MSTVAVIPTQPALVAVIDRARAALETARSSAEFLDIRDGASVAYGMAKDIGRLAKAKGETDTVVAAAYRVQADALEIESLAKRRLADEYDAAQERGEVQTRGGQGRDIPDGNNPPPTVADIGLTSKQVFEARLIRDAEEVDPGVVRRTLDERLASGQEPTRTAVVQAVAETVARGPVRGTAGTGDNEWYTPAEHLDLARQVLGTIDLDPASSAKAQSVVLAKDYFDETVDGLKQKWRGNVWLNPPYAQPFIAQFAEKMVAEIEAGRVTQAIMLTHNYTDTAWFQKLAKAATAICFTRGRVKFVSPEGAIAAPTQGQAFFYFGTDAVKFTKVFRHVGFVAEVKI